MTAPIYLILMDCFFKPTYHSIFEYLLTANSKNGRLFGLISKNK